MYSGAALSFGHRRACRSGVVLSRIGLSYTGGKNDGSSAIIERPLLDADMQRVNPNSSPHASWASSSLLSELFEQTCNKDLDFICQTPGDCERAV